MPSRYVSLAIVAFWVAISSWLFVRDLWPELRPGGTPPYTIDLAQEASGRSPIRWTIFRNGQVVGHAHTWVQHQHLQDSYELHSSCTFNDFKFNFVGFEAKVKNLKSVYQVTKAGKLEEAMIDIGLGGGAPVLGQATGQILITGHVQDGDFHSHWTIRSSLLPDGKKDWDPAPIEIHDHVSFLSPMMSWDRLYDIREGQTWRMTLFNPVSDSLNSLLPGGKAGVSLLGTVAEGSEDWPWDGRDVPCWKIECKNDKIIARTWVEQKTGRVLRQETAYKVKEGKTSDDDIYDTMAMERLPKQ